MRIVYCQGVALAVVAIMLLSSVTTASQSGHGFCSTSAEQNLDVASWEISGRDTGIATQTPWSVRKQRLSGGRQDGVDLVTIDNGRLTMTNIWLTPRDGHPARRDRRPAPGWTRQCAANYGPPLLAAGSRFVAPARQVTPFNAHAAKEVATYAEYGPPTVGFIEQVYNVHPNAGADGRSLVMLRNAAGNRAVSMGFALTELPYFTLWKNLTALEEGYVTGLEPGTGFPYTRRIEREAGRVPKLKPGETRRFSIDVGLHTTGAEVMRVEERIARIQNGRPVQVDPVPAR